MNLAHQGDVIFATWFTYDAAGEGWWLAMTANKVTPGTYSGALVETAGTAFSTVPFDPARVTRNVVGSGTLAFRDADNATFSYTVKGVQQSKSITRETFGSVPACSYRAKPEWATATNYQDLWWAAGCNESGWGINLTHQGDVIFATWFTYDLDGTPLWLAVTAPRIGQGNVYSGSLVRTSGPALGSASFDPAKVTRTVVGTATFTFANGNAATFAYSLEGVTRTRAITRQLFAPPAGTCCHAKMAAVFQGKVLDGYPAGVRVCVDANASGRCDAGEAQALSDATGAYELPIPGDYDGALVAEVVAAQARATGSSGATAGSSYRLATPSPAYSANISPFTTLVRLTQERDFRLAEEMVRNELGLPPGFRINLDAVPAEGTLARVAANAVADTLAATDAALGHASPDALATVIAALPDTLTELPTLRIATKNAAPVVSKEDYVDATFTLANPAGSPKVATLNGKIRGRGNTTWLQDKKPYKVQFTNDASYAALPDFLGMKKSRNWALLADHLDRTLMRNKLVTTLGNSSLFADGLKWTPSGQHLEVWLNGDYVGVYLLSEDIRIDSARLAIRKMNASASAGDVDGGYIVEVDAPLDCYNDGTINLQLVTPMGARICLDTPDEGAITPAQQAFIKNLLVSTESDIYSTRNLARINPVSFADWYLVNELFRNQDATFYSSDFLWRDGSAATNPADRLLNMGPLWDFDITAGNTNMYDAWKTEGCWVNKHRDGMANWFPELFENRDFLDLTLARWKDKRPALEKLIDSSIAAFARRLDSAQRRNFTRWPILQVTWWNEVSPYYFYGDHVAFLKQYLHERMTWLDKAFESPESFAALCK